MIVCSLLNSGPFHGWFALQFKHNTGSYDMFMILIGFQSFLWSFLFLVTMYIVINLLILSNSNRKNQMLSYIAYQHQLV